MEEHSFIRRVSIREMWTPASPVFWEVRITIGRTVKSYRFEDRGEASAYFPLVRRASSLDFEADESA